MKNTFTKILSYVLVAVIASVTTVCCCVAALQPSAEDSKLLRLQSLLNQCFIGEVDRTKLNDAAASAMVDALGDRWSYYISAEEYGNYQNAMNNVTVDTGITVQALEDGSGYLVLSVTGNSPAVEAGLQKNDVILAADGNSLAGLSQAETSALLRGEAGTQVRLTVRRGGEVKEFTVTRKSFRIPVATYTMLEGNVGLVTIENFDARCAEETIAAIKALQDQGATALIFDVRNNPGGYKHEMVKVLDYLLPSGELFKSEDYRGSVEINYSDADHVALPMAVLINGNSYSAAEFFAAALNDYDAAIVVGEKTSGKGYFQSTFELGDGSAVNLSIGKYYTPGGISLAGVGLTPEVPLVVDEYTAYMIAVDALEPTEDPQIMAAVNVLKSVN